MINTPHKIDLDRLKQAMPIMDLAKSLGLEIRGRQARCYNSTAHKHNDRSFSLGLGTQPTALSVLLAESRAVLLIYLWQLEVLS